jgi:hypothetical protein
MKALLIEPEQKRISEIDVTEESQLSELIGYPTLESDNVGDAGDMLYFDEKCFLRGTTGRFQIDKLIPVSGKGVVIGVRDGQFADTSLSADQLKNRIQYL